MKVLVIVPAYNEEAIIAETIRNIREKAPGTDILAVNDGSADRTEEILLEDGVGHLRLSINLGIGGAVQSGYLYADRHGYDYAVQIDGDGQHDPSYIWPMIRHMEAEGADLCIGSRFIENKGFQSSAPRRAGIRFLSALTRLLCGVLIRDVTSGYRVANRRTIGIFAEEYSDDYPEADSIPEVIRQGGKVIEYPVVMRERTTGRSSIGPVRSLYYMIKVSISILNHL